jgi:hypothetical protein
LIIIGEGEGGPLLQDVAIENVLQREHQLEEEEESHRIEANASDDVSIWHQWMQWTETFRGKDLAVLKHNPGELRLVN